MKDYINIYVKYIRIRFDLIRIRYMQRVNEVTATVCPREYDITFQS